MAARALAAVFVLSVAAAGASAAEAATTLRERPLATTDAYAIGDARTVVAWDRPDGRVGVLLEGRRTVLPVVRPACPRLVGAGAGRLLFRCDQIPPSDYIVVEPRSGAHTAVYTPSTIGDFPEYTAIGDQWMAGGTSFHTDTESLYLNWRTGTLVQGHLDPFGPAYRLDLDRPRLARRLCRPFERRAVGDDELGSIDRYAPSPQVDGHWVLTKRQDGYRFLGRCGSVRRESLGRSAALGAGYAIYDRDGVTRLRRLRDGHAYRLATPGSVLPVGGRAVVRRDRALTVVGLPR